MGDTMVPSYIVVNPDGTVGADFTGRVHAKGLDLDEPDINSPPIDVSHYLGWEDGAGVLQEFLLGFRNGSKHTLAAGTGVPSVAVIASDGASNFLQLAGDDMINSRHIEAAFGSDTAPTNGLNTATKAIAPALDGRTPIAILATPIGNTNAIAQAAATGPNAGTVRISHRDAAANLGSDTSFFWLAIG